MSTTTQANRISITTPLPGPKAAAYIARDEAVTSRVLGRVFPLVPESGRGCWITDVDGNTFLDLFAGIAVCATGHCHPAVVKAVEEQARRLIHAGGADVYSPGYAELCERLVAIAPAGSYSDRWEVFLTNSGTESVEGALKLARYFTGRQRVIAFRGGFHGRTAGSLSLTASKSVQRRGFGPLLAGVEHLTFPNRDDCPAVVDESVWGRQQAERQFHAIFETTTPPEEVAAIVAEPIQGEGGYIVPPAGFFPAIRELCDRHGILFIADEVQTGFGRTGKWFAIEHWGVQPDIICMAKGISSGVPVGGFMARKSVATWSEGAHGSTWGGTPIGCAAARATIRVIEEEGLMENAMAQGEWLMARFRELAQETPRLVAVRGMGLMIGLETADKATAKAWMQGCFERGVLTLTAGAKSLRLAPPLILSRNEAEIGFGVMRDVLLALD
ncbi:MAG: aminotransferase class III-fold pyridoxal phosphate-dependent enzyme [Caldilineaceae bacterium]